jgi:DNA-binding MarR family transcriptional regulator
VAGRVRFVDSGNDLPHDWRAMSSAAADVAAIRAFNRFYTARIGALRDGLLATAHPLPEARVLFEVGQREATDVGDLRRTLELDGGYLSRLLARLESRGSSRASARPATRGASASR